MSEAKRVSDKRCELFYPAKLELYSYILTVSFFVFRVSGKAGKCHLTGLLVRRNGR